MDINALKQMTYEEVRHLYMPFLQSQGVSQHDKDRLCGFLLSVAKGRPRSLLESREEQRRRCQSHAPGYAA